MKRPTQMMIAVVFSLIVASPSRASDDLNDFLAIDGQDSIEIPESVRLAMDQSMRTILGYSGYSSCKAARKSGHGLTHECADFCDTFQPLGIGNATWLYSSWAGYVTLLPAAWQQGVANAAVSLTTGARVSKEGAQFLGCGISFLAYAAMETWERRRCELGTSCAACSLSDRTLRASCRMFNFVNWCSYLIKKPVPNAYFQAANVSCAAGVGMQRESFRNICRNSCQQSMLAQLPISAPVLSVDDRGNISEERLCCQCERVRYQKQWLPLADPVLSSQTRWSVTSNSEEATPDCEGMSGSVHPGASWRGTSTYFRLEDCHKVKLAGSKCNAKY